MKVKRILSMLITACMLLSLIPAVSVSAATTIEWEYTVGVGISQMKDAECKKKNAITVKLKFTDNSEETKFLENTDTKTSPATAKFKTTRAPWTLNGVELSNSSKDSLWMYTIWIKVSRVGSSAEPEYVLLHYPGTVNDFSSGQPIDQDDKGPASYPVPFDAKRQIWGTDNFMDALNKWYNLNPLGESGTIKAEWSGKIKDTYVNSFGGAAYDCTGLSEPPTMKVTASGLKEDGTQVTKDNLVQNGVKFLDKGYEIDRAKLIKYMNENNMGQIHLRFTLEFPETSTTGKRTFSATTTIRRRAFCVDSVSYSRNYGLSYSNDEDVRADNRYYNNSSGNTVTATVYIKSTGQFAGYAYEFINKTVDIGEAYLTAGDDIKIPANEKSVKTVGSKSFNLTFNLPNNVESGDAGLTLVIKDAYLDNSGTKYVLWDSKNNSKDLSLYTSIYKIDRKEPTFAIEPEAGVDLSKWNKTVTLYATPSELTYSGRGTPQKGYATMYLYGNGTYPAVYKFDYTEQDKGTASAFQNVPSAKDFRQKITIALRDRVEGEYKLRFYGYDEAGNYFDSSYAGIKLDNKAPQISVTEKQEPQKSDGTKGNIYNVKISDASGTGRLYYMFTEKSRQDAPAFDENNDVPKSSGEMDTTLDRWAYIEQKDTENGNTAAAYLNVQKGQNFNGRILYFGIDEAGNKTAVYEKSINIQNENTAYDITPKNVEIPTPSYNITITTNTNNTVYYRWKNAANNKYITEFKKYSGVIDTSTDDATKSLNGTYILECKIVPPSGTNIKITSVNYVFDNEGPTINLTAPSATSGKDTQTVSVYATDASDVASATGKIVNPDGTDIEGNEEFALNVSNGILSQNVTISDIPSGSYALRVTATDTNGKSKTELSESFLIRNTAPDGSVNVKSDISHNDKPLTSSEDITLEFDISESFNNPSYAKDQALYYRIGTALGEYGQWVKACDAESTDGAITAKATSDLQKIALVDGENTLFVQTAICNINDDLSKISQNTIKTDEVVFYYDETAPTADLVINDYHTNESISGKLYVSDNLGGEIFASCESAAVEIGEIAEGEADVTVSESIDTFITVSDASGNETKVKLAIRGIDKTPPTADIEVKEETHGARKDSVSTVKVNDVLGETVKFAFIPVDKYTDGDIPEEYFAPDAKHFKTSVTRSELAEWDGENNITYKVQILGATGKWYLGVRSADSLGNSTDIVFKDKVLSAEDVALTQTTTPRLTKTESRTIVDTKYNVPVYTLPQNKILDEQSDAVKNNTFKIEDFNTLSTEEKIEAVNFELAKQYAMSYSDSYSFVVSDNGNYDLYTVDDLGRTNHLVATVEGVEFGAASNIKVTKYKKEWKEDIGDFETVKVEDGEFISVTGNKSFLTVEAADPNDTDTLFMNIEWQDNTYGLTFKEDLSEPCYDENNKLLGYSKLGYEIDPMYTNYIDIYPTLSDKTDRLVVVKAFTKGADYTNNDQYSEKTAVISNIDNTEPIVNWSVSPQVLTYEYEIDGDGIYEKIVTHPTPGNVTFTFCGQDKELGIEQIWVLCYYDENGDYIDVYVPMTDETGAPTEYWSWDGTEHSTYVWDDEQGDFVEEQMPIKVEYFGDGDIYGVKTLKYTFTDAYRLNSVPYFINSLDAMGMVKDGMFDGIISTEDIIYKIPIEENVDFNVTYYYENANGAWEEIEDIENTYYKNAKAVIDIPEDSKRGLYVSNNSRQKEKVLNNYQNEFTFSLKDKYGYTMDVPVSLNNFDTKPGVIDYTLQTTEKTNTPYDVTINVSDNESGIGSVILTSGGEEISLSKSAEGQYSGKISQNGTYSITLYDKVGNKTAKSFNVKNIDTTVPTASVTYSTEDYTSNPVSATLYFSKQNVRIMNIEPVAPLTSSDYSVNYSTSTITFTKSGTVTAYFEDDYGNSGAEVVAVANIDKTPPKLEAVMVSQDTKSVSVSFNKVDIPTSYRDMARKESEIFVTYGGITKTVADEDGNKNSFVFHQNGNYTFKVHDKEGLSSYLSIEITDIDTSVPKITSVSWSYDYDEFDEQSQTWVTKSANKTYTPTEGKVGYVVAPDIYSVTNQDVNVTVETDSETRLVGSSDDYTTSKEKVYDQNGMFIFNTEKKNGLTASYGVDIAIIDKTPPTIDLLGKSELVFYENPSMNTEYDISMLKYIENGKYEAYKAYDVFNGKKNDLTENVEIDWGGFNPDDLSQNTFDSSKPYTITYRVTDSAHNTFEVKRTVRLVGLYDTVALVNDNIPDFAGRCAVRGDKINISLLNFAGTAYVRYQSGIYTMGQMKKAGSMIEKNENGDFEVSGLDEGWYTFYIQTDKRDYFTLCVYLSK